MPPAQVHVDLPKASRPCSCSPDKELDVWPWLHPSNHPPFKVRLPPGSGWDPLLRKPTTLPNIRPLPNSRQSWHPIQLPPHLQPTPARQPILPNKDLVPKHKMCPLGTRTQEHKGCLLFLRGSRGKLPSALMVSAQQVGKNHKTVNDKQVKTPDTFSIIHSRYEYIYVYIIIPPFFL